MVYNNWFNLCALLLLTVLLVLYYMKFQAPFLKFKIFLVLLWLALLSTVASLCNNALPGLAPVGFLQFTNTLYFVTHGLITPGLLLYAFSLTDPSLHAWRRLIPWLIPTAFSMLLILTSGYSDLLFRLDEAGCYHRGPLMILVYLVVAVNFAAVAYHLIRYWRVIPRQEGCSLVLFLGLATAAVLVQMLRPELLVENFICALCLTISQLSVQNPEMVLDGRSRMLNKQGFTNLMTPIFERNRPFWLGFLLVDNYHELEKTYGYTRLESRMQVLTSYLERHSGVVFARLEDGLFCFPSDGASEQEWSGLLRDLEEKTLIGALNRGGIGVRVRIKTGVLECPRDADSYTGMLELLDMAAQLPIPGTRSVLRFSESDVMRLRRRKQIHDLVRGAVKDGSLSLMFQPIYCVKQEKFCAAEALLRMHTKQLGDVSPGEFIPIAEDSGAIVQLTRFVVESVCRFIRDGEERGVALPRVHINLSAIDCAQEDMSEWILDCIRRYGIDPGVICLEITETAFGAMPDGILANLSQLCQAGVMVSLDDYGTGYSNLNRLYSMPLNVVKLDKTLVDDVLTSEAARIILESTIRMMKNLNKRVLAEGVETREQAEYLMGLGVNYIQGYYFSHPVSSAGLEELFRRQMEMDDAPPCGEKEDCI